MPPCEHFLLYISTLPAFCQCRDYVLRSALVVPRPCLVALLWTINRIQKKKKDDTSGRRGYGESCMIVSLLSVLLLADSSND